jgi:hypothetical protein
MFRPLTGLKILCYLALACEIAAAASLALVSKLGVCPRLDEGGIECVSPFYESIAGFGATVVLMTVFTGIPGLLALGAIVFLIVGVVRRWRSRPV